VRELSHCWLPFFWLLGAQWKLVDEDRELSVPFCKIFMAIN